MRDLFFQTQDELISVLRSGDVNGCERMVTERLAALPDSPFHVAIDLSITRSLVVWIQRYRTVVLTS